MVIPESSLRLKSEIQVRKLSTSLKNIISCYVLKKIIITPLLDKPKNVWGDN